MSECLSLGKNPHDNGFGAFRTMLAYKLERKVSCFVKVPRNYASTKTCHCCGSINKNVVLGVSEWDFPVCSQHHNRDVNAAINIRNKDKEIMYEYFLVLMNEQSQAKARADKFHAARKSSKKGKCGKKSKAKSKQPDVMLSLIINHSEQRG